METVVVGSCSVLLDGIHLSIFWFFSGYLVSFLLPRYLNILVSHCPLCHGLHSRLVISPGWAVCPLATVVPA